MGHIDRELLSATVLVLEGFTEWTLFTPGVQLIAVVFCVRLIVEGFLHLLQTHVVLLLLGILLYMSRFLSAISSKNYIYKIPRF